MRLKDLLCEMECKVLDWKLTSKEQAERNVELQQRLDAAINAEEDERCAHQQTCRDYNTHVPGPEGICCPAPQQEHGVVQSEDADNNMQQELLRPMSEGTPALNTHAQQPCCPMNCVRRWHVHDRSGTAPLPLFLPLSRHVCVCTLFTRTTTCLQNRSLILLVASCTCFAQTQRALN